MRQTFIPNELEAMVDSLRGDTPFEQWLAMAIQEKAFWGTRFTLNQTATWGHMDELWAAVVELEDGHETLLLWRHSSTLGVQMMPVVVHREEDIEGWEERMALELNFMDGPPISWRHFTGGEFVKWLRAPSPQESE